VPGRPRTRPGVSAESRHRWPAVPHRWNLTPAAGIRLQRRLADRVRQTPCKVDPILVAGVDAAFSKDGKSCLAGVVVWDLPHRRVVEQAVAHKGLRFPYVPGLLSFREAPAVLAAVRKLRRKPDVFIFDAQGVAHPRRFGLASHVGVLLDHPSIGCAKSRLCGQADEPKPARGSWSPLVDDGQVVGALLRTRANVNCVYVSVGHRVTLDEAISVVLTCCTKYRLPEPTRLAHQLVTRVRADLADL